MLAGLLAKPFVAGFVKAVRMIPWQAWALVCGMLALWMFGNSRFHAGIEQQRAADEKAQAVAVAAIRKQREQIEAGQRDRFKRQYETFERNNADALAERDSVIAGLRNGSNRLRGRFQCPAIARNVSEAAGSPGADLTTPAGGLLNADAEFLVRFASEADAIANQLAACQAILKEERK